MKFKSGFVTIIGKANVGKSSLLNAIINEKVSIVSPKPQTTRNKILGILNEPDCQIVFIDTPGIHKSQNKLDKFMQKSIKMSKLDADILILVLDASKPITETDLKFIENLKNDCENIIIVVNKTDKSNYQKLYPQLNKLNSLEFIKHIIPTSAIKRENVDVLIEKIKELLPYGEKFYNDDIFTDKSEKFMVAEIIREKTLLTLQDEVPYGIAIEIVKFEELANIINIEADIICERESHKKIIIGSKGDTIKNIGSLARIDMEKLLQNKVFLKLFVKVRANWRNNNFYVSDFGYDEKNV